MKKREREREGREAEDYRRVWSMGGRRKCGQRSDREGWE